METSDDYGISTGQHVRRTVTDRQTVRGAQVSGLVCSGRKCQLDYGVQLIDSRCVKQQTGCEGSWKWGRGNVCETDDAEITRAHCKYKPEVDGFLKEEFTMDKTL